MYRLLKEYRNRGILSFLFAKLLLGEKVKLMVDGTIPRTQRIKRFSGKAFWGKKKWKVLGLWEIGDAGDVGM